MQANSTARFSDFAELDVLRDGEFSTLGFVTYPQPGIVRIDNGVLILANGVIARGLFREETYIGQSVRVGNLSFVSHNVSIGSRTIVGHGVTIAGHARAGEGVTIGPGATISDGVKIGGGARVTLGSVVVKDVPPRGHVTGNFAVKHSLFLRRHNRGIP